MRPSGGAGEYTDRKPTATKPNNAFSVPAVIPTFAIGSWLALQRLTALIFSTDPQIDLALWLLTRFSFDKDPRG